MTNTNMGVTRMEFTEKEREVGSKVERISLGIREELYGIDPNINVSITRLLEENKRLRAQPQKTGGLSTDDIENIANAVESRLAKYVG